MPCYHVTLRFLCLTSGVADGILFGTTERGCETHQLSQSVGNNTLRNGLCRHVGTGLVGPNSVLGQWRSQKFSTGVRRSVAFLSVHSHSGALPSRPYNQKTSWHTAWKNYVFSWQGVRTPITSLVWLRHCLGSEVFSRASLCDQLSVGVCVCQGPPYFVLRPRPLYQRHPGQSVTMPCAADGDPKPTIAWRKVRFARRP